MPLDGEVSFADLAAARNVDENLLRRVLRQAMTNNIFREPRVGYVAHTAESSALVRDPGTLNWIGYTLEESFPASAHLVEATKKFGASEAKNETAWNLANNTDLPIFEYLGHHPDRAARFAETMTALTSTDGYNVRHILDGYPWDALGDDATVVDVSSTISPNSTSSPAPQANIEL